MNNESSIFLAGHNGLVGRSVYRRLHLEGFRNILTRSSSELDLRIQKDVEDFFQKNRPEYIILAAAKVGGILANSTRPAEFIYDNITISSNIIHAAYKSKAKKLLNLGSSCIYPRNAAQPLKEEYLLSGPLEKTNEAYAVAKIAAIKLCSYYNKQYGTDFLSVMPTNLYGPGDNFDLNSSHVLPALLRKIYYAHSNGENVTLWGDGTPLREFLYVDDLAEAVVFLLKKYHAEDIGEIINIGTGMDITIKELAEQIGNIIGFTGDFFWDTSKPNGTPRKVLDISRMKNLGWKAGTSLSEGIEKTLQWYKENFTHE